MGSQSAKPIFPLSLKVVGIGATACGPVYDYTNTFAYVGFNIVQPYNLYQTKSMSIHFACTFDSGVPTLEQHIPSISVGSVSGPLIPLNYTPVAGVIDFVLDLTSLISATGDNTIYINFPLSFCNWSSWTLVGGFPIYIRILKAEMLYQVIGVH